MNQIAAHHPDEALEELLSLPDARKTLAQIANFFESHPLTGDDNPTITIAEATIPGIGRVTNLEARITGRYRLNGDLHLMTDVGQINATEMIRSIEAILDEHGK